MWGYWLFRAREETSQYMYIVHATRVNLYAVFDKFVRAKNANSVNVTGTNLGLFVAKKMVDSMGGKVWAESEG